LDTLGLGVERLAELHDVQAALAQRRTDRGRRIRLACRHLQLDVANDLLGHGLLLTVSASARVVSGTPELLGRRLRAVAAESLRRPPVQVPHPEPDSMLQSFSTWPNSSSTGVARPKIVTDTRMRVYL